MSYMITRDAIMPCSHYTIFFFVENSLAVQELFANKQCERGIRTSRHVCVRPDNIVFDRWVHCSPRSRNHANESRDYPSIHERFMYSNICNFINIVDRFANWTVQAFTLYRHTSFVYFIQLHIKLITL